MPGINSWMPLKLLPRFINHKYIIQSLPTYHQTHTKRMQQINSQFRELDNSIQNQAHLNFNNHFDRNLKHKQRNGNKKRFPPNKSDGITKRWTDKNKDRKKSTNSARIPSNFDSKNPAIGNPKLTLNLCNQLNSSLTKINAISYLSTLTGYHPVGQSQRQKFLRSSPIHALVTNPETINSERKMNPQ